MKLKDLSISEYTLKVSEKSSTPGGGSVLALTNELAASLLLMVCNFTINKKKYEQYQEEIKNYIVRINALKEDCHNLIDEDAIVFDELMKAYSIKDKELISKCSINAALIPLVLLTNTDHLIEYAKRLIEIGNKNVVSDAKIALDLLCGTIKGSLHHIKINLASILDDEVKNNLENEVLEREKAYELY